MFFFGAVLDGRLICVLDLSAGFLSGKGKRKRKDGIKLVWKACCLIDYMDGYLGIFT